MSRCDRDQRAGSLDQAVKTRGGFMQKLTFIGIAALAAVLLALAPTALAGGSKGGKGIVKQGSCTGSSTWKLKVKSDDGRIETEFEVDQNRVGKRCA
jgi:hypothetical protein